MVRALVLAIAIGSVFGTACDKSSSSSAPQVAANTPAGKVSEVAGTVEATRGGTTRVLAVGNEVFADDVIATASDGSVVIELFHNRARWAVEGGMKTRVDASVAWKLAKQEAPAGSVEHATSAAGRHAERQAADSKSSTETANEPAAAAPAPDRDQAVRPGSSDQGAAPTDGGASTGARRETERAKNVAPLIDPPKAKTGASVTVSRGPAHDRSPADQVRALLEAHRAELAKCLGDAPKLTITVRLRKGTPSFVLGGAKLPDAKLRACVAAVVDKIAFPAIDADGSIELVK